MANDGSSKYVGYIYKITDLINDKIYIGKRQKSVFDENYWGSGIILNRLYEKYSKDNFKREVVEWCTTPEELCEREVYWISFYKSTDSNIGYNLTTGGDGASYGELNVNFGSHTNHWTEVTRERQSNHMKGVSKSAEHRQHLSEANKGKHLSEETRKKMSESWDYSKHFNEKSIKNMSIARKGKKFSDTHKQSLADSIKEYHKNNPKVWITNNVNNTLISKEDELPVGWRYGRTLNSVQMEV